MSVYMNGVVVDPVEFAKALADETRQEIMRLCCCCWLSVGEIVAALNVTQPTVSHHLAILKTAGLVKTRREGKQIYYTLNQRRIASGCCTLAEDFAPDHELTLVRPEP
jgi:ArsR family transcriptional regulator, arsenate/arsenite/antimonite-responsive transcriptional repressor